MAARACVSTQGAAAFTQRLMVVRLHFPNWCWTLTVKRGPFLALAQERNRVRLPSQITSLGRFYWLEGPGLSASHPPTLGRQVYVTQRSSCSCGWGMCSWPLRPTHMSVRTCNAR